MEKVYGFYIIVLPESYFSPLRRLTSLPSIDLLRPSRIYLKLINIFFISQSLSIGSDWSSEKGGEEKFCNVSLKLTVGFSF